MNTQYSNRNPSSSPRKAIALLSGGLDSLLAARVIMEQGIHVEGLNFYTGFFGEGCSPVVRRQDAKKNKCGPAWVANQLGIKLHVVDAVEAFQSVFLHPAHGYGAHLNPCLDCKIFVVQGAKEWIKQHDFDFILSGEVLGQRPMSQRRDTMNIVIRDTDTKDVLLRPLSAKLLKPTMPELEGWVDREKLYGFSGRSRQPQMALAKQFGFDVYPQPAGGCVLTEASYCVRLSDWWASRGTKDYTLADIQLLKVGRHIRLSPDCKMIVGREKSENEFLRQYDTTHVTMRCVDCPGSVVLLEGNVTAGDVKSEDLKAAARITARYSKGRDESVVKVRVVWPTGEHKVFTVVPYQPDEIPTAWYLR